MGNNKGIALGPAPGTLSPERATQEEQLGTSARVLALHRLNQGLRSTTQDFKSAELSRPYRAYLVLTYSQGDALGSHVPAFQAEEIIGRGSNF